MIQEASISNLIRTILIIIGVYYVVKFLSRIFLPVLLRELVNKAQENITKQQEQYRENYQNQSNNYSNSPKNDIPKPKKQVGEYIDYEEIKD